MPRTGRPRGDYSWQVERPCKGCGESFLPATKETQYHSHACYLSSQQNVSALRSRASSAGIKGGVVWGEKRREAGVKSYAKVPHTDIHAHRAIAEQVLGRGLLPGEIVHHEDLNKRNNDPHNLIVFPSQADHARHHGLKHCMEPCSCPGIRLGEVMPNGAS